MGPKHLSGGALTLLVLLSISTPVRSQETVPPPPPATSPGQDTPPPIAVLTPRQPGHGIWSTDKKGKQVYVGPTNVVEQAPTPMLDEEGKQQLDPDGKPMFNPPVRQRRDKQGHPVFDEKGEPVMQTADDLGYGEDGKKIQIKKTKAPKTVKLSISRGTLTVDGLIGKAALNYEIEDLKYIYLYAPWVGTVIVSNLPFPGAKEQPNAFNQHALTVTVDEHTFELYSDKLLLGKNPVPAYVQVNREFKLPSKAPEMGYGPTLRAPYVWPGAKENAKMTGYIQPPPVPASLRPTTLLPPCPSGQMRAVEKVRLPGEAVIPPGCVPIVNGRPSVSPRAEPTVPAVPSAPVGQ